LTIKEKFSYFSDEPISLIEEDKFNFNFYVDAIYDILNNSEKITTIGLFGKWGIGKSSILYLLKEKFQNSNNRFIILDAWTLTQLFKTRFFTIYQ
jgi:predicted KAP-like P-loop ATPase